MCAAFLSLLAIWLPGACAGSLPAATATPPAHAEVIAHETELLRLTLTPEAQGRLGLQTARIASGTLSAVRAVPGEIVIPPNAAGGMPTNSLTNLQQVGAQQAIADGEIARAAAQSKLARVALSRAESLVRQEAGSVRARDEAAAALGAAEAALDVARRQRHLLGQPVEALATQPVLWVRASVFGSDIDLIRRSDPATVRMLGDGKATWSASPVPAPPSANAAAGTIDLYYALPNTQGGFRVGQRVAVDLPRMGQSSGWTLPASAVVRDIYGGEWVYRRTAQDSFVRQRIEVAAETDGRALLARGLGPDAEIVVTGAAELFGTEFGAAH